MAQQTIGLGTVANDGTGDPLRTALDKCNDNFTELYGAIPGSLLTTRGDLIARGASAPQRLALGTAGYVLGSDGTDAVWVPARERLTTNRTYYVRTDGSNSNNGLTNSAGGAFLTIQYAYNLIRSTLDLAGFTVTIQLGDGTYTAGVTLTGGLVGGLGAYLILKGNAGTPSNVVISTTSASCVLAGKGAYIKVQDLKLQTTTAGDCLGAYEYSVIEFANVEFGACATHHCEAWRYAQVNAVGSYTISGGAISHLHAFSMAYISLVSLTVTLTGTPAFSSWFCGNSQSNIACAAVTFSGSATGTRYLVHKNGVTDTSGGGASFFPGNAAGSTATGGVYA